MTTAEYGMGLAWVGIGLLLGMWLGDDERICWVAVAAFVAGMIIYSVYG